MHFTILTNTRFYLFQLGPSESAYGADGSWHSRGAGPSSVPVTSAIGIKPPHNLFNQSFVSDAPNNAPDLPVILEYHSLNLPSTEQPAKTFEDEDAHLSSLQTNSSDGLPKDIVVKTEIADELMTDLKQCNVVLSPLKEACEETAPQPSAGEGQIFKCQQCSFKTWFRNNFLSHLQSHLVENNSNLLDVQSFDKYDEDQGTELATAEDEEEMQEDELINDFEITSYNCELCSFQAPDKHALSVHGKIHKGGKGFQCGDCSFSTTHKHSLIAHRRIHTGEKPFRCLYCDYSSRQKTSVLYHQKRRHARSKLLRCPKCQFRTGLKKDFDEHLLTYHPDGNGPYQCPSCQETLTSKAEYVQHMESHLPLDKILRCPICLYSTRNKNTYNWHVLRHRNKKRMRMKSADMKYEEELEEDFPKMINGNYHCKYCPFKTRTKGVLVVHTRRHTGEKPYACTMCEYRSAQAGNLDSHLKNHEIKKNFNCPHCSYSAGYEAILERHVRRDHVVLRGLGDSVGHFNDSQSMDVSDGHELSSSFEGMCQVQLEEHNEEMKFSNDASASPEFLCEPSCSKSSSASQHSKKETQRLPLPSSGDVSDEDRDPYVTLLNGIYRCNECFFSTRQKENMNSHQYQHERAKTCRCNYCDYRCVRNQHLQRHIQKYKGDPAIRCQHCNYRTCVLNPRHRKMCAFLHDLYSKNANVEIDNSLVPSIAPTNSNTNNSESPLFSLQNLSDSLFGLRAAALEAVTKALTTAPAADAQTDPKSIGLVPTETSESKDLKDLLPNINSAEITLSLTNKQKTAKEPNVVNNIAASCQAVPLILASGSVQNVAIPDFHSNSINDHGAVKPVPSQEASDHSSCPAVHSSDKTFLNSSLDSMIKPGDTSKEPKSPQTFNFSNYDSKSLSSPQDLDCPSFHASPLEFSALALKETPNSPAVEHSSEAELENCSKSTPEHSTKLSPEHFTKPSTEHSTKLSPEHSAKPSPEHSTKPSTEHSTKPSPEHSTKPSLEDSCIPAALETLEETSKEDMASNPVFSFSDGKKEYGEENFSAVPDFADEERIDGKAEVV